MVPIPSVHGSTDTINLLLDTFRTFQDIAKVVRINEKDEELKAFYAKLMAYCYMIRDHLNRINNAAIGMDNKLIVRILDQLESTVTPSILEQWEKSTNELPSIGLLRGLNRRWDRMRKQHRYGEKFQFNALCLNFGATPKKRNEFVESLATWEEDLLARYPEDPSQWTADDFALRMEIREPPYAVQNAAQSVFKALAACKNCLCTPAHEFGAQLRLGTYRKPYLGNDVDTDEELDFDMFLSMMQDWHEVHIHTTKEKAVKWAVAGQVQQSQVKKRRPKTMRVKSLCEPIQKIKKMEAYRLEFEVKGVQLYKLQSERSTFPVDKTKDPISLEQFLQGGSRSFTERTRRILALILSYAVLHLHDTPWLQPTWSSSNILFFRTASSAIPLRPFLQTQLSNLDADNLHIDQHLMTHHTDPGCGPADYDPLGIDPDDIDPDDIDPDDLVRHQCPSLITLAVMLMEVYFVTPFNLLAKKYDPTPWEDEDGNKLDSQTLRTRIYQEVIRPLENELSQAYSSISIDDLDRFAQTLDFASWDQKIQNQQIQTEASLDHAQDLRQTFSPSPRSASPYYPPHVQAVQILFQPPEAVEWERHLAPIPKVAYKMAEIMDQGKDIDYKASNFFDDETISEAHTREAPPTPTLSRCSSYLNWKSRYQKVYEKFIPAQMDHTRISSVKIAILDTGIDLTHPDIEARLENIKGKYNWLNEKFKKAVHDRNGHGTFTADLLLDYAPDAQLYIAKIAEHKPSSPSIIAEAINYAVETWQVDIISMSFGFPTCSIDGYSELESALKNAYANDVLLFAAASNNGGQLGRAYPAREPTVICVHSTDANGNRSSFSPTAAGGDINLATVGEAVESAWPVHLCDNDDAANMTMNPNPTLSYVRRKSGTSYATPIAAAIAAFLLLYVRIHLPDKADRLKSQRRMRAVLRRVAEKGEGFKPRDGYYFIDLSLYMDSLFGKEKAFIDLTVGDILSS
ncbi:hypothetical protein B7463_g889, partial [Scytalidium lignicola]